VDEEPLTPVVDVLDALEPGAPIVRVHAREAPRRRPLRSGRPGGRLVLETS
jgi:hypothetical protein